MKITTVPFRKKRRLYIKARVESIATKAIIIMLIKLATLCFFSQSVYGENVSELRKLAFSAMEFDEAVILSIGGEGDDVSEISRVKETSQKVLQIVCKKYYSEFELNWTLLPKSKWAKGQGFFDRRGTARGGAILPSEKEYKFDPRILFFATHGFAEIVRIDFPIECNETKDFYLVFYTEKLKPYIKGKRFEEDFIHAGKRKLKKVLHEHKTKNSYYFEFTYTVEPLFPSLPMLTYTGYAAVLYNDITGKWYYSEGSLYKDASRPAQDEYIFWMQENYGKISPPISKRISMLGRQKEVEYEKHVPITQPDKVQQPEQASPSDIESIRQTIAQRYRLLLSTVPKYLPLKEGGPLGLIWMGIAARKKLEAYDEVYSATIAFHNYATRALDYASEFLKENKTVLAKKYIEESNKFQQQVIECTRVANEAYRTGVVSAYQASKTTIEIAGTAVSVAIPKLDLVISGYFLAMDYGMDKALYGEDKAQRNTIIRALVTVAYRLTPFEKMVKEEIGSSQAEAMLRSILNNPEYSEKVMEILAKEGLWYAKHITKDTITKIADEVSSFTGKPIGAMQ
jgi:hypothetical protein